MTLAVLDHTFTYAAATPWGNVMIVPSINGWYEVRFQERGQYDDELLGTFSSVKLAIEAACAGALDTPSIDICLSSMKLPEDIQGWVQHLRGKA